MVEGRTEKKTEVNIRKGGKTGSGSTENTTREKRLFKSQQSCIPWGFSATACLLGSDSVRIKVNTFTVLTEWLSEFSLINDLKHYVMNECYESSWCSRLHCPTLCNNHLMLHRFQTTASLSPRQTNLKHAVLVIRPLWCHKGHIPLNGSAPSWLTTPPARL